ncbi:MAG: hypothetical protein HKN01_08765 [Acidimicrobiia bacterium]|nr:hypothetical protein [Acidimicrobiia bacterium]
MTEEKPLTRRQRLIILGIVWVFGVPFSVALWLLLGWIGVALILAMVWTSWDYYRRGEMVESMDGIGKLGGYLTDAFGDDD